jgi:DNA-binding CsgD family transcriptional regulator
MPDASPVVELTEIAASSAPVAERAQRLVDGLTRWLPAGATWLALVDPESHVYATVGSTGPERPVADHLDRREAADELRPGGSDEIIGVPLVEPDGSYLGMLTVVSFSGEPPSAAVREGLALLAPLIARGVSPMRSLLATARLVEGAASGVVLFRDGTLCPLPGLLGHALLDEGSPVVDIARDALVAGQVYRSFMWPVCEGTGAGTHARMTVLAATDVPAFVLGMLLVTPDGDCRGLTSRELEVLGLVVDGFSNRQIARRLALAPRTVAAHVEHILHKLDAQSRTLAAIEAERAGCYVPPSPPTRR